MSGTASDPTSRLVDFVTDYAAEDIPEAARSAARIFLLDSFGVAAAGSTAPWAPELADLQRQWGSGNDARSWIFGDQLPAPAAAFSNAYLIHNSEFDCIHEAAVVHPMAVTLPALTAVAERKGKISGSEFLTALIIGVDVACALGMAANGGMRFFRPATAGAFGAVAAIGRLLKFDKATLRNAMGAVYGQLSGNMQAHAEGSALLAMQIGFNARNAIVACDLAEMGLVSPQNMLDGEFGYYSIFEEGHSLETVTEAFGQDWRIAEVAHKPFPSGRATHGVLDAVLELQRAKGFTAKDIVSIAAHVPPLTYQLVARPSRPGMTPNQARLCIPYVVARSVRDGSLGVRDFTADALSDPETFELAGRISVARDDNPDPSALSPVAVTITLQSGEVIEGAKSVIYGNPGNPMTRDTHIDKFRTNWATARTPLPEAHGESLIEIVDQIDQCDDINALIDLLVPEGAS